MYMSEIINSIEYCIFSFLKEKYSVEYIEKELNNLISKIPSSYRLKNIRSNKTVVGIRMSKKSKKKIIVMYNTGSNSTMSIKNFFVNLKFVEFDIWDELDELDDDVEEDFRLQRMGIKCS